LELTPHTLQKRSEQEWADHCFSFFVSNKGGAAKPPSAELGKLFDEYRDDASEPDKIGIDGTMNYLVALEVSLEEPVMLAVQTIVKSPAMGEINRADFVAGWDARNATTIKQQKSAVAEMTKQLQGGNDPEFFKQVYRHSFFLARQPGQRAVMLDQASDFWRLLFGPNGLTWKTENEDWLETWISFLGSDWKKSISKDLWDQTLSFARKTLEDESMSWWSEEAAWPGVIDDFVAKVKAGKQNGDKMDTA
jgi:DCN1-like protein 1/2